MVQSRLPPVFSAAARYNGPLRWVGPLLSRSVMAESVFVFYPEELRTLARARKGGAHRSVADLWLKRAPRSPRAGGRAASLDDVAFAGYSGPGNDGGSARHDAGDTGE